MKKTDIVKMFHQTNAMLKGHFLLSSGLHSEQYLQCALLLSRPVYAAQLCTVLAKKFIKHKVGIVIGLAYGGIIVAHEMARALRTSAIFAERKDGIMQLRRGFTISQGQRVLIAEDVITTGKSVKEVIRAIRPYKPQIVGVVSLIDRSGKKSIFGKIPLTSVKKINIKTYQPGVCPLCKAGIPIIKPGSRKTVSQTTLTSKMPRGFKKRSWKKEVEDGSGS